MYSTVIELLNAILPVLYGLCAAAYLLLFMRDEPLAHRIAPRLLTVTLVLHLVVIALRTITYRHVPLTNIFESLTMIALALALVYKVVEKIERMPFTGVFIVTVAFLLQVISSAFISNSGDINELLLSPWFAVHATTAVIGYSAFLVSAIFGALYLMFYHELKSQHFGKLYDRLPPLEVLAQMNYLAAAVGFLLLTPAMIVGIVWYSQAFTDMPWTDPRLLTTLGVWAIYAIYVLAKRFARWSRLRLVYISLVAFGLMVLSTFVVNAFMRSFHAFT